MKRLQSCLDGESYSLSVCSLPTAVISLLRSPNYCHSSFITEDVQRITATTTCLCSHIHVYFHTYTYTHTHRLTYYTQNASQRCRKERWRRWKKILFLPVLTFRRRSSSGFVFVTLLSQITKSSSGGVQPLMCRNVFRGCLFDTEVMVYFISSCSKAAEKITWKPNWKLSPHFFFHLSSYHVWVPSHPLSLPTASAPFPPNPSVILLLSLALHASATTGAGYLWNNPAVMCLLRPNLPPLMTTG